MSYPYPHLQAGESESSRTMNEEREYHPTSVKLEQPSRGRFLLGFTDLATGYRSQQPFSPQLIHRGQLCPKISTAVNPARTRMIEGFFTPPRATTDRKIHRTELEHFMRSIGRVSLSGTGFQILLTLFSKSFSTFPRGTCLLSVSYHYLALDGTHHPLRTILSNSPTRQYHRLSPAAVSNYGTVTLYGRVFQLSLPLNALGTFGWTDIPHFATEIDP